MNRIVLQVIISSVSSAESAQVCTSLDLSFIAHARTGIEQVKQSLQSAINCSNSSGLRTVQSLISSITFLAASSSIAVSGSVHHPILTSSPSRQRKDCTLVPISFAFHFLFMIVYFSQDTVLFYSIWITAVYWINTVGCILVYCTGISLCTECFHQCSTSVWCLFSFFPQEYLVATAMLSPFSISTKASQCPDSDPVNSR